MAKISRSPTKATGGITADEKRRLDEHAAMWIKCAFRTDPVDPEKIVPAIEGIYAAAGLKKPRVVIVPSPLVMAFAYGASAAIWHKRRDSATASATASATDSATASATYSATASATDSATASATDSATASATDSATASATDSATASATAACRDLAGPLGISCAQRWASNYQGGNMWAAYDCYLSGMRDVIGLKLPEHEAYAHWERAAIEGGFRVLHPEFCMVSDFPEVLKVDERNRAHCEDGPSHLWRDGWALYHWHGIRVPEHWITDRANLDPNEVIKSSNVELRAAGAAIVGWSKMRAVLKCKVVDRFIDPITGEYNADVGELIDLTLPGLPEPGRFLWAECPRNGIICEGVPRISDIDGLPIDTALAAQARRVAD